MEAAETDRAHYIYCATQHKFDTQLIHKMSVTITVRIPERLREEIRKYGMVSAVVRRALEAEVERRKKEEIRKALRNLSRALAGVPEELRVRNISRARSGR